MKQQGQALVILLVFMVVAVTITTASVAMVVVNTTSTTRVEQGAHALEIAESGVENALLRILRNPNYSGETLTVGLGSATVEVSGVSPKTIVSQGTDGTSVRTVQAVADITDGVLTVSSWQEVP